MSVLELAQSALVVVAQLIAGALVLQLVLGPTRSTPYRFATALILGPAVLTVEMIFASLCLGSYSYAWIVLPWLVVGLYWVIRVVRRGSLGDVKAGLLLMLGLAMFLSIAAPFAAPAMSGDPASNFSAFGRLYGHLHRIDPAAAKDLSIFGHYEYPPLLASNESLHFMIEDASGARRLMLFFSAYGFAALLLGWTALSEQSSGRTRLACAALLAVFLLQPTTLGLITHGYADLPLVCALLWMLIEVARQRGSTHDARPKLGGVVLAGLALALTKDEGSVLAVLLALVIPLARGWKYSLVPLLVIAMASVWPIWLSALNLQIGRISTSLEAASLLQSSRIPRVLEELANNTLLYGGVPEWGLSTFAWSVLVLVAVDLWLRRSPRDYLLPAMLMALHFLLYVAAFATTNTDMEWLLRTASHRLIFHLVPYMLLAAGISLGQPEEWSSASDAASGAKIESAR